MNDTKHPYLIGMPCGTDIKDVRFCLEIVKARKSEFSEAPQVIPGNNFCLVIVNFEKIRLDEKYFQEFFCLCDKTFGSYLDYDIASIR